MARPTLDISPRVIETRETIRYEFELAYSDSSRVEHVFYEFARGFEPPPPENFDGILCAVLLHAMAERRDIRMAGPATRLMLLNLHEFQLAWSRWVPSVYQPIEIEPESVITDVRVRAPRALAAFSGGVDSSYTLLRNTGQSGRPHYGVDTVLLVHGFDVSVANTDDLRELVERTAALRDFAGVELRIVRTNSKELNLQRWEHSFSAQVAACMHLFSAEFSEALIASGEPYDALVPPWGARAVTDHLLSGGGLAIVHDGAAFSRTDKTAFLAGFPAALRSLKVCWEGSQQGRNCGVCEKCVRTQLNLLAVGVPHAPCFDAPLDLRCVPRLSIRSAVVLSELRSIVEYAERRNIDAQWLQLLRKRVGRTTPNPRFKRGIRMWLARAGLLEAARTLKRKVAFPSV